VALEITVIEKEKDKKGGNKKNGDPPPIGLIMLTLLVAAGIIIGNQPSDRSTPGPAGNDSRLRIFIP